MQPSWIWFGLGAILGFLCVPYILQALPWWGWATASVIGGMYFIRRSRQVSKKRNKTSKTKEQAQQALMASVWGFFVGGLAVLMLMLL